MKFTTTADGIHSGFCWVPVLFSEEAAEEPPGENGDDDTTDPGCKGPNRIIMPDR